MLSNFGTIASMRKYIIALAVITIALLVILYTCQPLPHIPPVTPTHTPLPPTATQTAAATIQPNYTPTATMTHIPTETQAPTSTTLPTATMTIEPTVTPSPTLRPSFYVVQSGDNLSWISEGLCGYQAWYWLWRENRVIVADPNLIYRGEQLRIPWPCK